MPQNWGYVGSKISVAVIVLTMLPETVYPFVYIWVHKKNKDKAMWGKAAYSDQKSVSQ